MNILCLEDDEDYALILAHAFKAQRTVSRAPCFTLAETIMERVPPDLILLDLTLVDSTPEETLARISKLKAQPKHPKVVVLTGNPHEGIRQRAYTAGADLVLQKGTDFRVTRDAIMELYRSPANPAACLDAETIDKIEATVSAIVARVRVVPSVPQETVARVVALLVGTRPMAESGMGG